MADDSECLRSMSMAHFIAENYLSFEPHCEKTGLLPVRKQRRRSASR